jgi:hypothetical protein
MGEDDGDRRVAAGLGALAFGLAFSLALLVMAFFVGLALVRCFLGGGAALLLARLLRLEARVLWIGGSTLSKPQVACYVTLRTMKRWQWEGSTFVGYAE